MFEELAINSLIDLRHPHWAEYLGNPNQRRFSLTGNGLIFDNPVEIEGFQLTAEERERL